MGKGKCMKNEMNRMQEFDSKIMFISRATRDLRQAEDSNDWQRVAELADQIKEHAQNISHSAYEMEMKINGSHLSKGYSTQR